MSDRLIRFEDEKCTVSDMIHLLEMFPKDSLFELYAEGSRIVFLTSCPKEMYYSESDASTLLTVYTNDLPLTGEAALLGATVGEMQRLVREWIIYHVETDEALIPGYFDRMINDWKNTYEKQCNRERN